MLRRASPRRIAGQNYLFRVFLFILRTFLLFFLNSFIRNVAVLIYRVEVINAFVLCLIIVSGNLGLCDIKRIFLGTDVFNIGRN
jgi:hypothetical protein